MGLGRGALLWLLGVPLPIIICWFFFGAKSMAEVASPLRPYASRFAIHRLSGHHGGGTHGLYLRASRDLPRPVDAMYAAGNF
jgi:hypothetical protein